jgi:hypothetical protein
VITPIDFWASFDPWENAMTAAERIWSFRNVRFRGEGWNLLKIQKIPTMMRNAMIVPASGEMTMAARIFEMPLHFRTLTPFEAITAPMIPPIIACEEEEGIP